MATRSRFRSSLIAWLAGVLVAGTAGAQEALDTPSQKTREAMQKFSETPAVIRKSLEAVTDAVKARLDRREKAPPDSKSARGDLRVPAKPVRQPPTPRFSRDGLRDPFLPYNKPAPRNPVSRPRDNLSPLERFELGQLRVTGIIWDIPEPVAMVEDTAGFGYIIRVGTPIGVNDGKVKTIRRSEVVVEEFYRDVSGTKKKRDVSLRFSHD